MSKRKIQRTTEEEQELNLAPIMNMVVILIPLLLLSVVFVSVSVINVSVPKLIAKRKVVQDKPWLLTVAVNHDGFYVGTVDGVLPPVEGCTGKASICLQDQNVDIGAQVKRANALIESGQRQQGEQVLNQALQAYDWRRLYNTLSQLKKRNAEENTITISADPDLPYAAVIRVFDVSRHKLQKDHYDTTAAFWSAKPERKGKKHVPLFDTPTISVVQ